MTQTVDLNKVRFVFFKPAKGGMSFVVGLVKQRHSSVFVGYGQDSTNGSK